MTAAGRIHERLPLNLEVGINSDHNFYTGFTQNISEGGLFIATIDVRRIGTPIEIKFILHPDPELIVVRGVVRWIRDPEACSEGVPPGMGIQFLDVTQQHRDRINAFIVRHRESLFYDD